MQQHGAGHDGRRGRTALTVIGGGRGAALVGHPEPGGRARPQGLEGFGQDMDEGIAEERAHREAHQKEEHLAQALFPHGQREDPHQREQADEDEAPHSPKPGAYHS